MREHGTTVCYRFGPGTGSDSKNGCRCDPCKAAVSRYEKERKQNETPAYVSALDAREHIKWLSTQGIGLKQVARISGVSHGSLSKMMYGKRQSNGSYRPSKRIRPETQAKILAVTPADASHGTRVPAEVVWKDISTLLGRGWTKAGISKAIGLDGLSLQLGENYVTRRNADKVHALLDQEVPVSNSTWAAKWKADAEAEPVAKGYDDRDTFLLEMVKILEARIDQSSWRARRACRGKPVWMFFPQRGDHKTIDAARAVCATCPVSEQCLDANVTVKVGIIGGTSERERQRIRRERGLEEEEEEAA